MALHDTPNDRPVVLTTLSPGASIVLTSRLAFLHSDSSVDPGAFRCVDEESPICFGNFNAQFHNEYIMY
jgi:hypothetical protein